MQHQETKHKTIQLFNRKKCTEKQKISRNIQYNLLINNFLYYISLQAPATVKKKVNIPTCDVGVDLDYEKNVSPTFALPSSYLRHSKKIGDDIDISIDYNMDEQDLVRYYSY